MEQKAKNQTKALLINLVHIIGLFNFAVAQPLYDLCGRQAEFFVAHNTTRIDFIYITVALSILLPFILFLLELPLYAIKKKLGDTFHYIIIGALITLSTIPLIKKVFTTQDILIVLSAISIGIFVTLGYKKIEALRTICTVSILGAILFPTIFLLVSPVSKIFISSGTNAGTENRNINKSAQSAPVTLIVFDEFETSGLMDENMMIDNDRFPNFASFSENAHWFRKATAVDISTAYAVPAILTGKTPDGNARLPIIKDYPNNLFSLLSGTYNINAHEILSNLSDEEGAEITPDVGHTTDLRYTLGDMGIIYLHIVAPGSLSKNLPSISHAWKGFFQENKTKSKGNNTKQLKRNRVDQVNNFIAGIEKTEKPSLNFLHIKLPHHWYNYSSTGKNYAPGSLMDGLTIKNGIRNQWMDEKALVDLAHLRYLLQVGFTDTLFGKILSALKSKGIYDESLIIVMADHGVSFRPGQPHRPLTEQNFPDVMTLPLMVKLPNQKKGAINDAFVKTIDVLPTIVDVLDIKTTWNFEGRSLFSSSFSDRTESTVYQHGRFPKTYNLTKATAFPALKTKIELFGTHTSLSEISLKSGFERILLKDVDEMNISKSDEIEIEIDQMKKFEKRVDLNTNYVPLYISGRVLKRGKLDLPINLAVIVNDKIVSITQTVKSLGPKPEFRCVLPENSIKQGKNKIEVLVVNDNQKEPLELVRVKSKSGSISQDTDLSLVLMTATDKGRTNKAPEKVRFAEDLLKNASQATVNWPNKKDWKYISVHGKDMQFHAPEINDKIKRTKMVTPIEFGQYNISAAISIRKKASYPVTLAIDVILENGTLMGFFNKTLLPGEKYMLDHNFKIGLENPEFEKGKSVNLVLSCYLDDESAKNNWNTGVLMKNFILKKW